MNKTQDNEIREAFAEAFRKGEGAWHPNFELITDWWLAKLAQSRLQLISEIMEKIPEEKTKKKLTTHQQTWYTIDGYNQYREEIIKLLQEMK